MYIVEILHDQHWRPARCIPGHLTRLRGSHPRAAHYFTKAAALVALAHAGPGYADTAGHYHALEPERLRIVTCECVAESSVAARAKKRAAGG
jgi:hypothetical protein